MQATNFQPLLFADDCKCLACIRSTSDCQLLQDDLDQLFKWSIDWCLPFNQAKCKCLRISLSSFELIPFTYCINGSPVDSVPHYCDLGVHFQMTCHGPITILPLYPKFITLFIFLGGRLLIILLLLNFLFIFHLFGPTYIAHRYGELISLNTSDQSKGFNVDLPNLF